jgi:hypothetical protein
MDVPMEVTLPVLGASMTIKMQFGNEREMIEAVAFFQSLPELCPVCDAPLVFQHRSPQDNDYYGLVCTGSPRHETDFGQPKDKGKILYYKASEKETVKGFKLVYGERVDHGAERGPASGELPRQELTPDKLQERDKLQGLLEKLFREKWGKNPQQLVAWLINTYKVAPKEGQNVYDMIPLADLWALAQKWEQAPAKTEGGGAARK